MGMVRWCFSVQVVFGLVENERQSMRGWAVLCSQLCISNCKYVSVKCVRYG